MKAFSVVRTAADLRRGLVRGRRQEASGGMLGDLKRDLVEVEKRVLDLRGHL